MAAEYKRKIVCLWLTQRAHCWFWGRPKGHIRGPKGHSALRYRPSENIGLWEEGRKIGKEGVGGSFNIPNGAMKNIVSQKCFSKIITTHSPPTTSRPLCPTECPETQAAVSLPWPAPPAVHNDITITSVRGW